MRAKTIANYIALASLILALTCSIRSGAEAHCDEFFYLVHSQFTLHGLWPNYERGHCPGKPGAWPENCDSSSKGHPPECDCPFDPALIADLAPAMAADWPGYGQNNAQFWKHEWDRHGSCAITYEQGIGGPVTSEHDYFLKALELRSQCNVLDSLAAANIQPGSRAPAQDYVSAIQQGCGVQPQVACHYKTSDLQEVRICYDAEFQAIDCQQAHLADGCTGSTISIPEWDQVLQVA